jgi:hypothetical protein
VNGMVPIGHAISEAVALGARFRLAGAEVEIAQFADLPDQVQQVLQQHMPYLVSLLDDGRDSASIKLLDQLGVSVVLAETRHEARSAVRQIIQTIARHGGSVGLDTETSPRRGFARERPWAKFNKGGAFSDAQPPEKAYKDPAGVDPHRADIVLAQLYPGGSQCFLFKGEALQILLRSHWLRRQCLVAHNLTFEIKFLLSAGYRAPPDRKSLGRQDCSEQATLLLTGQVSGASGGGLPAQRLLCLASRCRRACS